MSDYCYVQNDNVLDGPRPLPVTWTDTSTGVPYSNLPKLTDSELLVLGWLPYVENDPGRPGYYYHRQLSAFSVNQTDVSRDATYVQWDIEDIRADKDSQLESQLVQYTTNEAAINPSVEEYIKDDSKWLADEQVKLAQLTVWQEVADFNTAKPEILILPSSYVGAKNVQQGVKLTVHNTASVDSGLSAKWPQADINTYVAGNQAAAADPTNATAPVGAAYAIRQGVAEVSEQFNRIVVWRFDVEGEVDPNLGRSIAMRIHNRQDARDIFTFIYTGAGATYLGWKKFEVVQAANEEYWEWKLDKNLGDGSLMTWVDSNIAFVLSYIANPAVTAEWFTDKIQFPAGVESDNILVAWDSS